MERNNESKSLLTKFGWMTYHRTLFTSKSTQTSSYLVDDFLKESITGRMTLGVARNVLEEATQSSYQKGARNAGCQAQISKQTVKNLIHDLPMKIPKVTETQKNRQLETLHIVANEDHVALQFRKEKGRSGSR